jgi:aerobic-type carbon monoxide dehydrogenase small subunit (CoxS/CutS family)
MIGGLIYHEVQAMTTNLKFTLNGEEKRISTDPRRSLLEVLREDLGMTGTKYGCGEGQCRACTVLIDGNPVRSCLTDIPDVEGKRVETIEGLAREGRLHPVQQAFIEEEAMQCGYCVPGMIMTAVALLRRRPDPTTAQIIDGMNGNLCRCCGYGNILKAVQRAAAASGSDSDSDSASASASASASSSISDSTARSRKETR